MIFDNINVRTELVKERKKSNELLDDVNELLNTAARNDEDILQRLRKSEGNSSNVEVDVNAADRIFTIEQIRKICIRYRLRFLPTQHFKADFPYEVIAEISALEKKSNQKIENFRIIAPSEAFDLENINKDPLLFAELSDGNYYLIHQWGKDLKWYRRILTWPLQNFKTYFISLWILAAALVFAIPSSVMNQFTQESENVLRIWLTIHTFIALMGITFWAALTFEKTFSSLNWESKYYNW